jgi:acetyltransferase
MSVRHLEALFRPASIAVIGASDRDGSVGKVVFANLRSGNFHGDIWPVNLRHDRVGGQRAWHDVASLPGTPDLAVICTPPESVPGLIEALGRRGTRAAIVITAGLSRPVAEGGPSLKQAMLDAARPCLLRILGPNCIGALVPSHGLNASFAPGNAKPGRLAFVSQSGALATAMLDWADARGIGFSHFISLGDSADVDFGDVIDYLASDAATRAILLYVESIQAGARKFMSAARAAARNKPLIVVKAGRAPEGARAAASHTGALAGSDAVFDAAVHRAGMLRVDTLEALFDAAETLARVRVPWRGERLALLTNGGGAGVLAADALALGGGHLAALNGGTLQALDACLPATWSHGNPVDIIGDAPIPRYQHALDALLAANEVDGVLFLHAPTAIVSAEAIADACIPKLRDAFKPVLACWVGGTAVAAAREACAKAGVASYATPERAVAAWLQLATHARNQVALQQLPDDEPRDFTPDRAKVQDLIAQARADKRSWLDGAQALALLHAFGIPVVNTELVGNDADAVIDAARRIGYPVALKVDSPQVIHKSDVGGVALGLDTDEAVRAAIDTMRERLAQLQPPATLRGFVVQAMVQRPQAHELIAGINNDPIFGPVLLFGEGGIAVELRHTHAVALPPLNAVLARDMVTRSGLDPLLAGYRGRPAADRQALLDVLLKLSRMACDLAPLAELDINPLLLDEDGALAVDARVRLVDVAKEPKHPHQRLAIRPYPSALQERVSLHGRSLLLRPIRPEDGQRLMAFYAQTTPEDMRLRFFMARREVPHSELARYSQIDYDREMAFIALDTEGDGSEVMVGEARAVCDPDNVQAEFAVQVASSWQGRGLGSLLLDKLVQYQRSHGTQEIVGQCLPENGAMAALARRTGFEVKASTEAGAMLFRLELH